MKNRHLRITFLSLLACFFAGIFSASATQTFSSTRTDFRDESIYFLMTTRFYDGDPSNNTQCWDGQQYNVGDPAWRGDFKGVIEKLDYIKALGFTAIWITPIVENASGYDYHGYHAHDFSKVDHRYESEDVSFQTLIDEAHKRGMKVILDIVLQHTGNFGEAHLMPMFKRDWTANQSKIDDCMIPIKRSEGGVLPDNYLSMKGGEQHYTRLSYMKNEDGKNHDTHNYYHHFSAMEFDVPERWWGQIAGDCVDLNTEHPTVYNYLIDCYTKFIAMGLDGFRIDTGGHIAPLTFNKVFIPAFQAAAEKYKAKRNGFPFFMYAEICSRYSTIHYHDSPVLSAYYYTWKNHKPYSWSDDVASWDNIVALKDDQCNTHINHKSCRAMANDDLKNINAQPKSDNALLNGNTYHKPDYSHYSGLSVIDFPMHWNFRYAENAFNTASPDNDKFYNDATWNVVYVDSHDYAPDQAPEHSRFSGEDGTLAENWSLMFTYRGIPCIYYGSEMRFMKGAPIDKGPNMPLKESGRAYFGNYITGDVTVTDFGEYSNATNNMAATLSHPFAEHVRRLNQIRQAVPALRKGQYSRQGCNGKFAFKRRYVDNNTDSYALVTISGGAKFSGILNGDYTEVVTGQTCKVTNGSLQVNCSGQGNLRVWVLNTEKTKAPGKVGKDGKFIYSSGPADIPTPDWDGSQNDNAPDSGGGVDPENPDQVITPNVMPGEQCVFLEAPEEWGNNLYCYTWYGDGGASGKEPNGKWPGQKMTYLGNRIFKMTFEQGKIIGKPDTWQVIFNNNGDKKTKDGVTCEHAKMYNVQGDIIKTVDVEDINASEIQIHAMNGIIYISGAENVAVTVFNLAGQVIYQGTDNVIPVNAAGVYLVRIGTSTYKIML